MNYFSERANASLHELEDVLTGSPNATLNTSTRAKEQLSAAVHPRTLRWYEAEARPQKYKDAVSSLQSLLHDQDPKVDTNEIMVTKVSCRYVVLAPMLKIPKVKRIQVKANL